jgi:hypothetical protein
MKPSIGRVVLIPVGGAGKMVLPAIVTKVHPDGTTIDAVAFSAIVGQAGAVHPVVALPELAGENGGWSWPPRLTP